MTSLNIYEGSKITTHFENKILNFLKFKSFNACLILHSNVYHLNFKCIVCNVIFSIFVISIVLGKVVVLCCFVDLFKVLTTPYIFAT
jgi:hypothetical protein